ncbi:disulfide bond formation protein B [Bermanella marisrubri]|uniref:Disulfide bond formation protein B n=1 Tax=Bermanella marisrubri TaxID=207949 RepID=Q1MYZ6_9GAMM|nr:disulfide bond formation protein B [Bermanella marisrubri]EAT11232.1 Disulfide bond formation protein DsbB [Oceanobacter sp. RED65] [Bermanella marisrubri]QIZ85634.1 disulfide bond formation protein B [Bermanella marisrubri]
MALSLSMVTPRNLALVVFLSCVGLLGSAYYFEYVMFLDPCPLCIMQRIAVLIVGIGALGAVFWHSKFAAWTGSIVMTLGSALGIFVAGRHVWIQSLPADQVPTCGPSLDYMVDTLPWADVLAVMLRGNGNCAEGVWSFLGLSMPAWVLVWMIGFGLISAYFLVMAYRAKHDSER